VAGCCWSFEPFAGTEMIGGERYLLPGFRPLCAFEPFARRRRGERYNRARLNKPELWQSGADYLRNVTAKHAFWWLHAPIASMLAGQRLAIALPRPAVVHWGIKGWRETSDEPTGDSGLGFQVAALDVSRLLPGECVEFTWRWQETGAWQSRDYRITVQAEDAP